jgi:hypothetical protein
MIVFYQERLGDAEIFHDSDCIFGGKLFPVVKLWKLCVPLNWSSTD